MSPTLEQALAWIYRQEIKVSFVSDWDMGWRVAMESPANGSRCEVNFLDEEFADVVPWMRITLRVMGFSEPADWGKS